MKTQGYDATETSEEEPEVENDGKTKGTDVAAIDSWSPK